MIGDLAPKIKGKSKSETKYHLTITGSITNGMIISQIIDTQVNANIALANTDVDLIDGADFCESPPTVRRRV